jgi:hypothetical protein
LGSTTFPGSERHTGRRDHAHVGESLYLLRGTGQRCWAIRASIMPSMLTTGRLSKSMFRYASPQLARHPIGCRRPAELSCRSTVTMAKRERNFLPLYDMNIATGRIWKVGGDCEEIWTILVLKKSQLKVSITPHWCRMSWRGVHGGLSTTTS